MADETINHEDTTTKHKTKDSVFVTLFEDKKNVLRLYQELHPEDTSATIDDINIQTLKAVLVNTIYNDLGFIVGRGENARYILLVEAQSAWNPNMTLRMLFYLGETLRHFVRQSEQSVHSETIVSLPEIELYVVYSGDKEVPDEVSFNDDYFNGNSPVDIRVKILHSTSTTIYGQYIGFCKVFNQQHKLYGNSIQCIEETVRICIEKDYLADFLDKYRKEVITMLAELFDEQAQRKDYNTARDKKMFAQGKAEGKAEGKFEEKISVALNLLSLKAISKEDIAKATGLSLEKIEELALQV